MQKGHSYLPLWTVCYHNPKEAAEASFISSQWNSCKSAINAKCLSLRSHAHRMGVDLKLYGQRICLQAFSAGCSLQILNIICTNQGSDGEVLHMRVGKTYKAEINLNLPIKQKGSTELLFCYTELVRFCCPSHSRGSHRSPSTKLVKVFSLLLARFTVLYLWYINLHFS